jgi:hypothetical protein
MLGLVPAAMLRLVVTPRESEPPRTSFPVLDCDARAYGGSLGYAPRGFGGAPLPRSRSRPIIVPIAVIHAGVARQPGTRNGAMLIAR